MIIFENIRKRFDNFLLTNISFNIPKGYICGLVGENGSGKSTLIKLILGLHTPDNGNIYINGQDVLVDEVSVKNNIGYVLPEDLFDPHLTLIANADAYGKYYSRYDRETFLKYCKRFDLEADKKLRTLSKGQKLKFQFAFALAHYPLVLLLDEPTANFDPAFRKEFFKILTEFISDGEHSVLLATHLTSDLEIIGDYITFLHRGRLVFSNDRESLKDSFRLLQGEAYKFNPIPKNRIIHMEKKDTLMTALVTHLPHKTYDSDLIVSVPSVEDIMYYYIKENSHV